MNENYTIISATNRKDSNTLKIARYYEQLLQMNRKSYQFFSLEEWKSIERDEHYVALEEKYILSANKLIIIAPEYNASFPGILKLFIDCSDFKRAWTQKKALLTGVAMGRSGNIRGIDHLSTILQYLSVTVHPNKLPISLIHTLLDAHGDVQNEDLFKAIRQQVQSFIDF